MCVVKIYFYFITLIIKFFSYSSKFGHNLYLYAIRENKLFFKTI